MRFDDPSNPESCPLCDRPLVPGPSIDEHHLIPRTYKGEATVTLHRVCHGKIHAVLSEKELRDHYNTVAALRAHPDIAKFITWVRKKHPEFVDGHARHGRRRSKRR